MLATILISVAVCGFGVGLGELVFGCCHTTKRPCCGAEDTEILLNDVTSEVKVVVTENGERMLEM